MLVEIDAAHAESTPDTTLNAWCEAAVSEAEESGTFVVVYDCPPKSKAWFEEWFDNHDFFLYTYRTRAEVIAPHVQGSNVTKSALEWQRALHPTTPNFNGWSKDSPLGAKNLGDLITKDEYLERYEV